MSLNQGYEINIFDKNLSDSLEILVLYWKCNYISALKEM